VFLFRQRWALGDFIPDQVTANGCGSDEQKLEVKFAPARGNDACILARILISSRRRECGGLQIQGDAERLALRNGVEFAFVIENQRAAIRRDDDFLRTGDGDLPISSLPLRTAKNAFRDGQFDVVRFGGRKTDGAAADGGPNYIFLLRETGGTGAQ
jgi:hypothetical protein